MKTIEILSLGGGVQSSCMALMAAHGEISPMPKAAIFADVGDEPQAVYDYLDYLEPLLPFPVLRVSKGVSLMNHIKKAVSEGERFSNPPLFTAAKAGSTTEGITKRCCTVDFKVSVIKREVRRLIKELKVKHVTQWIGISLDEIVRMKPSLVKYSTHKWPLIDLRMTRHDCVRWMEKHGYKQPTRSACVYCPHHSNEEWRKLRDHDPEGWKKAVEFDAMIRNGLRKLTQQAFVHRSCVPLPEVDLSSDADKGQGLLWGNECEGMCGV